MSIISDNARLIQRQAAEFMREHPNTNAASVALIAIIAGMTANIIDQCEHEKNTKASNLSDYDKNYLREFQKRILESKDDNDVLKTIEAASKSNGFLSTDGELVVQNMLKDIQNAIQKHYNEQLASENRSLMTEPANG